MSPDRDDFEPADAAVDFKDLGYLVEQIPRQRRKPVGFGLGTEKADEIVDRWEAERSDEEKNLYEGVKNIHSKEDTLELKFSDAEKDEPVWDMRPFPPKE